MLCKQTCCVDINIVVVTKYIVLFNYAVDADTLKALVGAKTKSWRNDLLLSIERWMRDLVRLKASGEATDVPLNFPEHRTVLQQRAACYTLAKLLENLTMLEQFTVHLERNISPAQVLPYWMDRFYL